MTVICTIHQPPTETYGLFDRVMYLADGEVAYFGKRDDALEYFASIGMPCPAYYNMAGMFSLLLLLRFRYSHNGNR